MKRKVIIILTLTLAAWILTGCDPQKGEACPHVGDTWAKHGTVLHCVKEHQTGDKVWK